MKRSVITIAIVVASVSIAHATDRCTDAQLKQAFSDAPTRDGSILVAKGVLEAPIAAGFTIQVYDAQKEDYPLVCERQYTLAKSAQASLSAQRQRKE